MTCKDCGKEILTKYGATYEINLAHDYQLCLACKRTRLSLSKKEFYTIMQDETTSEPCPECGSPLIAKLSGGVACSKCDYWFCY